MKSMADKTKWQERERKKLLKRLERMAFDGPNDAVKLVFSAGGEAGETIDDLDLTMLSEVKHGQNGTTEMKFVNRLDVIRLLLDELRPDGADENANADFFNALSKAACDPVE